MQIVSNEEMSNPIFWENLEKLSKMSSTEDFTQHAVGYLQTH